jgi:hypothetical protein
MTRSAVAAAGFVIGVIVGVALVLLNPVAMFRPAAGGLPEPVRTLGWDSTGGFAGLPLTPGGLLGWRDDTEAFAEPGIRFARAEVVALRDPDGVPRALGVRLSAVARQNSLLKAQVGIVTDWNVLWPGDGSVLMSGSEDFWKPLRDGSWYAARGRGFRLRDSYVLEPLPGLGMPAVVSGSGPYARANGRYRERFIPVESRPGDFAGRRELQIALE